MASSDKNQHAELIEQLTRARDGLQSNLDDIRKLRMDIGLKSRDTLRDYRMKLGELSFTVGAAIAPVLIVTDNKVKYVRYALVGVAIYLFVGIFMYWRGRTMLYEDASDAPLVGLDQELVLEPIIHAYNKVIFDPSNEAHRQELVTAQRSMLNAQTEAQNRPAKNRVDPSVELGIAGFMFATLFVARTIWPYTNKTFWLVFWTLTVVVILVLAVLYVQGVVVRKKTQKKQEQVHEERRTYQSWHNKNVLGDR